MSMTSSKIERVLALLLLTVLLAGCAGAPPEDGRDALQQPQPEPEPPAPTVSTLAVCGDVMSHMPITNDVWNEAEGRYDYARIMAAAAGAVSAADYAVANLETTFAGGPHDSGFPAFNSPDDLARGLKETGFDLVLTANNHCLDRGFAGLCRTLDVLDEAGLAHVGTSRTEAEHNANCVLADVGGISVAFIGYTYGTNGLPLPQDAPYAVNIFNEDYLTSLSQPDEAALLASLDQAASLDPDLIAVMIHWGVEYQTQPNDYQRQMADFLLTHGADIILGGHSHVPQPMEMRTAVDEAGQAHTGFVCYSLGNFISSQNDPLTDTTAVLTLELARDNVTGEASVTDYTYAPMLMLDREGGSPRYDLLDVEAVLSGGDWDAAVVDKARQAKEDCAAIFGS